MSITELARLVTLSLSLAFLAGCATIVEGSDQSIAVTSDPTGATCEFQREGQTVGFINPTPGSIALDKSTKDLVIRCSKNAYEDEVISLGSKFEGMTFGNIIFGGIIGVGVDAASGAMHHYPENVTILMAPIAFSSAEERDRFYAVRRERITGDVQIAIQKIRKECLPEEKTQCEDETKKLEADLDAKLAEMEVKRSRAKIEPTIEPSQNSTDEEARTQTEPAQTQSTVVEPTEEPKPASEPHSLLLIRFTAEQDDAETRSLITQFRPHLIDAISNRGQYAVIGTDSAGGATAEADVVLTLIVGQGIPDNLGEVDRRNFIGRRGLRASGKLTDMQTRDLLLRFTVERGGDYTDKDQMLRGAALEIARSLG